MTFSVLRKCHDINRRIDYKGFKFTLKKLSTHSFSEIFLFPHRRWNRLQDCLRPILGRDAVWRSAGKCIDQGLSLDFA